MTSRRLFPVALFAFATLLAACDEDFTYSNEGRLCLYGADEDRLFFEESSAQELAPNTPLTVVVKLDECLDACTDDYEASCTISRDGDTLTVISTAAWVDPYTTSCNSSCLIPQTSCTLEEGLPEGTYTLSHGDDTLDFTIRSQPERAPCTGSYLP